MSEISDKRKLVRTLKQIKAEMSYLYDEEYSKIYNACVEVDNKYQKEPYLCDYINDQNFVADDEEMDYLIKQNSDSLERLRYFIGNTYRSDLYQVNAYGNLTNITRDDLKTLCDELIQMLNENIKELKQAEL
ncbi:MAG: hypothetical protein IKA31_03450 [Clostridia bacterium]|nr:hypothetical protein [Clostridia bacterium]MBR4003602.1 hypothetical protein [Clostridia bacterium]